MTKFSEDLESLNRRLKIDDGLEGFVVSEMHAINDSGLFALQIGDITIKETRRFRAEDFEHLIDIFCAINRADGEQMHKIFEEEDDGVYDDRDDRPSRRS